MPRLTLSDERCSKLRIIMRKERIYDKPDLRWVDVTGGQMNDCTAAPALIDA